MFIQLKKTQESRMQTAINMTVRRQTAGGTTFQLQDKRHQDKGSFVNHLMQPIQLVLKDPNDAQRNAELTVQYHNAEDLGDAISLMRAAIDDQSKAIGHYQEAIRLRLEAAKLHTEIDEGHKLAITVLTHKIHDRKQKIKALTPPPLPKPKVEQEKVPVEVKRKPQWFGQTPMGTGAQASWLTGISAWQPRK